jgi:serine/threonine protein kinase/tetratricopeptide (TPR) repeat protein
MTHAAADEKSIFLKAIEISSAEDRASYLDAACGDDPALRGRIEALLRAHERSLGLLDAPEAPGPTADLGPVREGPGTVIGPYKLLEPIGEGGMGVVYMAEQTQAVRRKVALKIIKPGMDTRQVIARFEAERQALALMDHPHIARVLDAGATDSGRPYFAMELVRGLPVTEYCDRHRLAIADRLELFVQVCQAVQHAHQKGIIHRDLKPTNVLVTRIDGAAVPKVIDFGVAKAIGQQLTEKTLFTGFAQLIGTPLYMSPEQAEFSGVDVDTRSDIYSLGVLLYELLTGTTPFDRETFRTAAYDEIRRIIREEEPPRPSTRILLPSRRGRRDGVPLTEPEAAASTVSANRQSDPWRLRKSLRGELDWIVMKCLEKDRNRRYETANGLAADLRRYLDHEPVEAGPPSSWYRLRKFARRNRALLATTGLVAVALVAGTTVSLWQALRATDAERVASRRLSEVIQANATTTRALAETTRAKATAEAAEKAARLEAAKATAINEFLTEDLLIQAEPSNNAVEDRVTLLEILDRAADKAGERFADQPEIQDAVRATIAETYHGLASWEKAERQWRAVLESTRRLHPGSAGMFQAQSELAHILGHRGQVNEALALAKPASDGLARVLGPDHVATLHSRSHLALAYREVGRIDEAVALDEATLKLREAKLGPDHLDTLHSRTSLALAYLKAGRTAEAVALLEPTLKLTESRLGPDHPDTLTDRDSLASAYHAAGRTNDAVKIHEATLKLMESRLGPDHADTFHSRNNLAEGYREAGRIDDAIRMHEATLKWREAKLGPDHPHTLISRSNLALAYKAAGRIDEAVALVEATLKLREAKLGPSHPDTLKSRHNLATAYLAAHRTDDAIRIHEANLKLFEANLGRDHPDTLTCRSGLATAYWTARRTDDAIAMYEATLKLRETKLGPDHPDTLGTRQNLAAAYWQAGRLERSVPLFEATLKLQEAKLGPDHPDTLLTRVNLGVNYRDAGRPEDGARLMEQALGQARGRPDVMRRLTWVTPELAAAYTAAGQHTKAEPLHAKAEPLFREGLEQARRQSGPTDRRSAGVMAKLAFNLIGQRKWSEAEPLLRECLAIRKRATPDDWSTFSAQALLGEALLGQKKYAEAEPLLIEGYEGLNARAAKVPATYRFFLTAAGARIVQLYDAWEKPDKAAEWRQKLARAKADPEPLQHQPR